MSSLKRTLLVLCEERSVPVTFTYKPYTKVGSSENTLNWLPVSVINLELSALPSLLKAEYVIAPHTPPMLSVHWSILIGRAALVIV